MYYNIFEYTLIDDEYGCGCNQIIEKKAIFSANRLQINDAHSCFIFVFCSQPFIEDTKNDHFTRIGSQFSSGVYWWIEIELVKRDKNKYKAGYR